MAGAAEPAHEWAGRMGPSDRKPGDRYIDRAWLGRGLMSVATLMYGVVPLVVDLTETHVFHPDWPAHARFHMVWLLAQLTLTAGLALVLIWRKPPPGDALALASGAPEARLARIRLAAGLGFISLGSFYTSAITAPLYGGALAEPGGVAPVWGLDANLVSFSAALVLLLAGLWLAHRRDPW